MTVSRHWQEQAGWLKPLGATVDLGLHLTLSGGMEPLGAAPNLAPGGRLPTLGSLIGRAVAGTLPAAEVAAEIERQFDAFEDGLGTAPDFVDGHQHVQHLPTIRKALIAVVRRRYPNRPPYLRVCRDRAGAIMHRRVAVAKTSFVAALAGPLGRLAAAAGIPINDHFRGIHDFSGRPPIRTLFRRFLADLRGVTIINCHPGRVDDDLRAVDPLTTPREAELAYLGGPDFQDDLTSAGVFPARFDALRAGAWMSLSGSPPSVT